MLDKFVGVCIVTVVACFSCFVLLIRFVDSALLLFFLYICGGGPFVSSYVQRLFGDGHKLATNTLDIHRYYMGLP